MKRFDRYVLSQLLLLFGFFALILVSIYWINRAVILFDQLIADGQSAGTFLALSLLTLPNVIRMVLPIAAFVATVYAVNRLTVESELVVAQASGLSPWRLARPVVAFGLIASALMGVLVHVLVPQSRIALAEREAEIEANVTARILSEGRFLHPTGGVTFYIREITPQGVLQGVFLSDARDPGTRTTYMAAEGYIVREGESGQPTLLMLDGSAQTYEVSAQRLSTTVFDSFSYDVADLAGDAGRGRRDVREYPTHVLFAPSAQALAETGDEVGDFLYEAHLRVVQPFTPLIAALVGFAALRLGGYSRFGVWKQIGLAVGVIILVQVGENAVADAARRDTDLWPLIYAPFLGGLAAALTMLLLAAHPPVRLRPPPPEPGSEPAAGARA
ncbi:LPS export ABC transporter permease LptF [Rhodovulum sp. 12E13]|uniref:LPS export ABC transporter permease LptF n=1 Tax=Rhodovulum sp. 12E13 TaxID=2203891 RepID=UPI000E18A93C|nr:LPS export ABC transporter permease LptF [Rhodovulum sp. 12E13]RDC73440.1 LPS export ABC transporter permease LptF [Rhodovulum sp. 12E13]